MKIPEILKLWPDLSEDVSELYDNHTDELARRHDCTEVPITPSSSNYKQEDHSIFRDPVMATPIDFNSEDGFKQAAKKKKAAAKPAKSKWGDDEDEGSKKDDGEGSNGGDKAGDAGGDAGDAAGAGDGDDKKDEDKKDEDKKEDEKPEEAEDDAWSSFVAPKSKKKGKKNNKVEDPPAEPAPAAKEEKEEKFDAFHEIKLDDTVPSLDLDFGAGAKSSSGFGSWGSSWNTGTTTT